MSPPETGHRGRSRVRGYAPWTPRAENAALVSQVRTVLTEYSRHLPLTGRQIFYRLVAAHGLAKTEQSYKSLLEVLSRARRAGLIPFASIRDDGITRYVPNSYTSIKALLETFQYTAGRFRLDRQTGQPARLFFAVEAAGMVPQIARIADGYGITTLSCGGFDSTTAKHCLAVELQKWPAVEVLHAGDHDPSGTHVFLSLAADVRAFIGPDRDVGFTRLLVTPQQIADLRLQTAPPKPTDRRSFEGQTAQAEAIAPDMLATIIRDAIEQRLDHAAYAAVLAAEEQAKAKLLPVLLAIKDSAP